MNPTPAEDFERAVRLAIAAREERRRAGLYVNGDQRRKRYYERLARALERRVRRIADRAVGAL